VVVFAGETTKTPLVISVTKYHRTL